MSFKQKISGLLAAVLLLAVNAFGQYRLDQPVIVGKEQGLPTNDIRGIVKGQDGFIWLATLEGLCRFDGQHVTVFRLTDDPATASFDNGVNAVLAVGKEIWIGTSQGISVFSTIDERFRHYQLGDNGKMDSIYRRFNQGVQVLYQDRQGDIWIGTREKGVWLYDRKKDDFKKFSYPPAAYKLLIPLLGPNTTVLSIEASNTNDSIVWVGTVAGLQEINKYSGKVNWYTFPQTNKDFQVSVNAFRRLCHADDGLVYIGSWSAGMNVFDPVTKTLTPMILEENHPGRELLKSSIGRVKRKSADEIWITTIRGLVVYNIRKHAITLYKTNDVLKSQFYGVDYIDESNRIWHSNINGIQYYDPVVQQLTTYSFDHLLKEWAYTFYIQPRAAGTVIVCPRVTDGLLTFNKSTNQWAKYPFNGLNAFGHSRLIVKGFARLSENEYLVSAEEGLFIYSLTARRIYSMPGQPPSQFKRWGEVIKDDEGNYWISADMDGVLKWNPQKKQYRFYKEELLGAKQELRFGGAVNFYKDSRNNIWFARKDGYSVHLYEQDTMLNFLYEINPANSFPVINGFAEDKQNRLWITSADAFYGYIDLNDPAKGITQKFDLKEKQIRGFFNSLASDKEGNVWGYTNKELIKINARDMSLSTFNFDYGVKGADFFHFSFLPGGEMIFGGRNSITFANPHDLQRNTELPVPYILQLKLSDETINPSVYNTTSKLDLGYRQNFITVFFSAKAYTMAGGVKFRYRLKEFDDWIEVTDNRMANYTNVPPGNYVFQLQAANNEGVWNEKMLELPLYISTPWWQTWWFRTIAVLAISWVTYQLYHYRIAQVRKKEKLKTQYEKKLANVEMTALLAQMNPHFLFNSLNSIDSYIIKNESDKASEYLNNFARLIRLILQNSRSNYISLKDELEALDLYLQMEMLRFKDKFEYEIKTGEGMDAASFVIPPMLIQPYVENAIWHGLMHKKDGTIGKVIISVSYTNNSLVCVVEDNGIGREKALELKMQKPGNRKRSMAMQITKERLDMINKLYNTNTSVEVIDLNEGGRAAGTRVELVIPV
jgi:ligand-binding sensor domain-containing protein